MNEKGQTAETNISDGKRELPVQASYEVNYQGLAMLLALVVFVGVLTIGLARINTGPRIADVSVATTSVEVIAEEKERIDPFENIKLLGKAAFVWDVANQEKLYAYNEEVQLPLASLTKLATVAAATQYLNEDDILIVELKSLEEEGDSGLFAFEEWRAKDLIDFTLLVSSNDGADVLASAAGAAKIVRGTGEETDPGQAFVNSMNKLASDIGLQQTYFMNETGLDPNTVTSGGYGSARDIALLLEYIVATQPQLVNATVYPSLSIHSASDYIHSATNTNEQVGNIPGLIASKTGFTDLAGGNLVIAFDAGINRPVIISVLGSTRDGRFTDVERLVNATLTLLSE